MKTLVHIAIILLMTGCLISCFLVPIGLFIGNYNLFGCAGLYMFLSLPLMMLLLEIEKNID